MITKLSGKTIPAGKDDSYIEARYDALIEDSVSRAGNDDKNARAVLSVVTALRTDSTTAPADVSLSDVLTEDGTYDENKVAKLTSRQMQKLNADRDANAWRKSTK